MFVQKRHLKTGEFYYVITGRHDRPLPCGEGEQGKSHAEEVAADLRTKMRRNALGLPIIRPDEEEAPSPSVRGVVYFIGAGPHGPVKIGFSRSKAAAGRRLRSLQIGHPVKLEVLAVVPGTRADERSVHERFRRARLCGEWFLRTDSIVRLIRDLCRA